MTDPSICYDNFINILNDMFKKNCLLNKKSQHKWGIYTPYNPWLTNKLKNAIKKKNKLFSLYKYTNCISILSILDRYTRYTKLKNKIKTNIKNDKNNYYKQLFSHNKQEDNWKIINRYINKKNRK